MTDKDFRAKMAAIAAERAQPYQGPLCSLAAYETPAETAARVADHAKAISAFANRLEARRRARPVSR